jgi:hypothetical protein
MLPASLVEATVSKLLNAPIDGQQDHIIRVELTRTARGGWEVIATFEGYILARQHCHDWHRAERAYTRMKAEAASNRADELTLETIDALLAV